VINRAEVPEYESESFSCFQYIHEEAHEGLGQKNEDPWNHYLQNKQSQEKAVLQHPGKWDTENYIM